MDTTYAAACAGLLVFIASVLSVEWALSAAILEIALGVLAGNLLSMAPAPWMDFLAGFGVIGTAIVPTFIAQRWFSPKLPEAAAQELSAREEESA